MEFLAVGAGGEIVGLLAEVACVGFGDGVDFKRSADGERVELGVDAVGTEVVAESIVTVGEEWVGFVLVVEVFSGVLFVVAEAVRGVADVAECGAGVAYGDIGVEIGGLA